MRTVVIAGSCRVSKLRVPVRGVAARARFTKYATVAFGPGGHVENASLRCEGSSAGDCVCHSGWVSRAGYCPEVEWWKMVRRPTANLRFAARSNRQRRPSLRRRGSGRRGPWPYSRRSIWSALRRREDGVVRVKRMGVLIATERVWRAPEGLAAAGVSARSGRAGSTAPLAVQNAHRDTRRLHNRSRLLKVDR